ncbi:hypothetical protein [Chryseobacterium sp. A301]
MNNVSQLNKLQAIVSVGALLCLLTGWFNFFSPEVNEFLYQKLFYVLIGISFVLMAPILTNPKFVIPMYIAAALCVIGIFFPIESRLAALKTIGLFAGVLISLFNRPRVPKR